MGDPSMIKTGVLQRNPFPGIRPFTSAEDKYFFGREGVVSEILDSLLTNKFVALVGASGSGKTSLVQSGIIPALITDEKKEWVPVSVRPGTRPVENLIRGVQQVFPKKITESDVQSFLAGFQSLGDLLNEKGLGSHNYYLVVDQFEELFISGPSQRKKKKNGRTPETVRFVELLVKAVTEERPGIYVMLSIRSDFIDACSTYRMLTEQMNRSKYLLPQMNRDALSKAILGPIRKSGADVEPGFEEYLLDDLEELDSQLAKLQHALMRTWDYWIQQGDRERPIAISDYQAIGTVSNALSDHLDEAFDELDQAQQKICERMFKTITYKGDHQDGFSRKVSLGNIARIAQCSVDDLTDVVEVFRRPGRAFIAPFTNVTLTSDSEIELAHESLISIWDRLQEWVEEESDSVNMYLKLSEASALYQQGRTELWKQPELQVALNWRESQNPTPAWGVQFNPAFERAMVFLSTSEDEYLWQEERKVILKRRRRILNRAVAIASVVVVLGIAGIYFVSKNRPESARKQAQTEEDYTSYLPANRPSTPSAEEEVVLEPVDADQGTPAEEDQQRTGITERENQLSNSGEQNRRNENTARNNNSNRESNTSRNSSNRVSSNQTTSNRTSANQGSTDRRGSGNSGQQGSASSSGAAATAQFQQRALSMAKNVSIESREITRDPDLQGLLAYEAYQINSRYNGKYYDADIYNGLYTAMKKLISPAYNIYPNIRSSVKDIVWLNRTGSLLTASSDGSMKILSGNLADRSSQISLAGTGIANECLSVSPNERVAAVGTNGGGLLFIELENQGAVIHRDEEEGKIVLFLENLGNSGSFLSAGTENRILKWEYEGFTNTALVTTPARPSSLAASSDGRRAAYGTRDGRLFELLVSDPGQVSEIDDFGRTQVTALTYSPGGQYLVAGLLDGSIRVLAGDGRRTMATLRGPGARISDLAYSPDGRFLVAASNDGNVYLWSTSEWEHPPVVFTENNGFVLSVCFNRNSSFFYAGSVDYPRMVGRPAEASGMAREFCSLLSRNLTQAEWDQYFGGDLPYEKSCPEVN